MTVNCAIIVAIGDGHDRYNRAGNGGNTGAVVQRVNYRTTQNVKDFHLLSMKWHSKTARFIHKYIFCNYGVKI